MSERLSLSTDRGPALLPASANLRPRHCIPVILNSQHGITWKFQILPIRSSATLATTKTVVTNLENKVQSPGVRISISDPWRKEGVVDSQNNNRQKIGSCLFIVDAHVCWLNALFHLHGHQDPRGALSLLDSLRQKIRFRQDGRPRSVKTSRFGFKNNGPNNRDHTEHQGCC